MSDISDQIPNSRELDVKRLRRMFIPGLLILGVLIFGRQIISFYVDWLWFQHDAQAPEVFSRTFGTRVTLWLIGFLVAFTTIFLVGRQAGRTQVVFGGIPAEGGERQAADALAAVQKVAKGLGIGLGLLGGWIGATYLSAGYESVWLFQAGGEFGKTDPIFGMDMGFFVFKLPFFQMIINYLAGLLFFCVVISLLVVLGVGALAKAAKAEHSHPGGRRLIAVCLGLFLVAMGAQHFLGRYSFGVDMGELYTGPGYAANQALVAVTIMGALVALFGLVVIFAGWSTKLDRPLRPAGIGLLAIGFIGEVAIPGLTTAFVVKPNRIAIESPFVKRAIEMTRYGYGLDSMESKDFTVQDAPTAQEVADAESTLQNMRLWDPGILGTTLEAIQSLRPFYGFHDVDIDRYEIDGETRMVMLGPRNVMYEGVSQESQDWVTRHLVYTHGYGITMSAVNGATASGRPSFLVKNMPPEEAPGLEDIEQPRIYFSHYPPNSSGRRDYLILNSAQKEFDFPSDKEDAYYTWTGQRGIPLSGMARLALSFYTSDFIALQQSDAITADSRLILRRDIVDRAAEVYPMLRFDFDPYLVASEGKLYWMVDAYTTTDQIPYSRQTLWDGEWLNYVRNSVKLVVDAYSGEMTAYVFEDEPLIAAQRRLFPDLFKDREEMPEGLLDHIRYGEDGFNVQAHILTQYHVTDPRTFISNEDAWEIPGERDRSVQIIPYYVQMRLPNEQRDSFMLILPFTPRQKNNMIGWMAAHCDPEEYGRVVLYKFPKNSQTQGPIQMEATFNADPQIADINRQLNNDQSQIVSGNLLIIPIGSSILYVKPLFLQSRVQPIPELKKVALGVQDRVVVGDTYQEALDKLFGQDAPIERPVQTEDEPDQPETAPPPVDREALGEARRALQLLDEADAALREGDFSTYGTKQKQARDILRRLSE